MSKMFAPELDLALTTQLQLISFVFWSFLYIFICEKTKGEPEWCNRIATLFHGSSATIFGFKLFKTKDIFEEDHYVSVFHHLVMFNSWGYFAFDMIWCLIYWTEGPLMLCHHLSALTIITRYICKGFSGNRFCGLVAALEATNPFLQTRWFLRYHGYRNTTLFHIIEKFYLSFFIILRGVFGSYILLIMLGSNGVCLEEKLMYVVLYVVSLGFIWDMYLFICRKYGITNYFGT